MSYDRVQPPKVADAIVAQIEDLMLDAILTPGERLPGERELAEQLRVSRSSLRDALVRLEARGLLRVQPGGGTFVRDILGPTLTDPLVQLLNERPGAVTELLELRQALEEFAAYHAAERATGPDLEHLQHLFDELESRKSLREPNEESRRIVEFHLAIAYASHNVALMHIVRGLFNLMRAGVSRSLEQIYLQEDAFTIVHDHRRDILQAIIDRKPEAARAAAHALVMFVNRSLSNGDAAITAVPDAAAMTSGERPAPRAGRQSDAVAADIERRLATGELGPGQALPNETDLAAIHGISRAVVREALVRLEARGLLEFHHSGELRVQDIPGPTLNNPLVHLLESHPAAVFDFLELRTSLEELATSLAAARADDRDLERLRLRHDEFLRGFEQPDPAVIAVHDTDFHLCLAEASHNVALVYVMRGLFNLLRTHIRKNLEQLHREPGAYRTIQSQHQTIYDAVMARDPESARDASHQHIAFVHQTLRQRDLHAMRAARSRKRYTTTDPQ